MFFQRNYFSLILLIFLVACKHAPQSIEATVMDSVVVESPKTEPADTIIKFQSGATNYIFSYTSYQVVDSLGDSSRVNRFKVVNTSNNESVDIPKIEFMEFGGLKIIRPTLYTLDFFNPGGSSVNGSVYLIRLDSKITILPLLEYNELSAWKFNKDASEVLFYNGIWNMGGDIDSENFEAHFSPHQFEFSRYTILPDSIKREIIGTTKFKYDFLDSPDSFDELAIKEPEFYLKLNLKNYLSPTVIK